jgi:pimeloyl-ACP methyl ester carboxylesterase
MSLRNAVVTAPLPESRFVEIDGLKTHYIDVGSGPAVVLLHGSSLAIDALTTWRSLINALKDDFRVVAFDQIGFGLSDLPPNGSLGNRLERVAHARRLIEALGLKQAALVGHSEGAFMAARLAIELENFATAVVAVTSGGLSPRLGGEADASWIEASRATYTYETDADNEDGFIRQSRLLTSAIRPDLEERLRQNYRRPATKTQLALFRQFKRGPNYPDDYLALQTNHIFSFADRLPQTLLVWADCDKTVPVERALALQKLLKNADLHVFSRAAHMVMYDREDGFNALLRNWLGNTLKER